MTAADWDRCTDPQAMLEWLRHPGKASERKFGLFAVACCRRILPLLGNKAAEKAVELCEKLAEEGGSRATLSTALTSIQDHACAIPGGVTGVVMTTWTLADQPLFDLGLRCLATAAGWGAVPTAVVEATNPSSSLDPGWCAAKANERAAQAALLREVVGNPFRPLPHLDPSLLDGNRGAVVQLALGAYEERLLPEGHLNPARLAVLADAVEEAGGAHEDMLRHLRQQGQAHVRGCWAVDLLLGRA